jgi:hypothetical protein
MNRRILPSIKFKAYRKPSYLRIVYDEFGTEIGGRIKSYHRSPCPICRSDSARGRCFAWSFEKCAFYCFKCKARGDALELVRLLLTCSVVDAAKWLEQRGGPSGSGLELRDNVLGNVAGA